MPGYGTAFGRGLILGAGAALLYAAARETLAPARPASGRLGPQTDQQRAALERASRTARLIDWELAARVAIRTAGKTPTLHPGAQAQLQAEYEQLLREIEGPIAAYTGNELSLANTKVEVLDRAGWIRVNMVNFRELLQPVEDFYRESATRSRYGAPPQAFQNAARMMLSSQVGILVGYLARRVLGQYDIGLLSIEPLTAGKLYFVEPNLARHRKR